MAAMWLHALGRSADVPQTTLNMTAGIERIVERSQIIESFAVFHTCGVGSPFVRAKLEHGTAQGIAIVPTFPAGSQSREWAMIFGLSRVGCSNRLLHAAVDGIHIRITRLAGFHCLTQRQANLTACVDSQVTLAVGLNRVAIGFAQVFIQRCASRASAAFGVDQLGIFNAQERATAQGRQKRQRQSHCRQVSSHQLPSRPSSPPPGPSLEVQRSAGAAWVTPESELVK